MEKLLLMVTTSIDLYAFFAADFEKSNSFTVRSSLPDAKIGTVGWNSKNVMVCKEKSCRN